MTGAPTDEAEIDALAVKILTMLAEEKRPILFHMSALASCIANVAVASGQEDNALDYITDLAQQMLLKRRDRLA
jgi:hypothetical protein